MAKADLAGFRVAALVEDNFEQVEFTKPKAAFEAALAHVDLISRHLELHGWNHHERGNEFRANVVLAEADPANYDALFLPGGVMNGDALRIVPEAQAFARAMVEEDKPVAVICHGGWLLISAGLVAGRTLTSWPTLQDDYRNAEATWEDREVVVDGNWVSSRKPEDIPAFARAAIAVFGAALERKAA
ncbi:MAG: type 1 glutamine amidotransferase [Acidobacteria bacterium]|nr:MAG: type 1 glutamine amidotransferase [Acidobacteriota bacterium]